MCVLKCLRNLHSIGVGGGCGLGVGLGWGVGLGFGSKYINQQFDFVGKHRTSGPAE